MKRAEDPDRRDSELSGRSPLWGSERVPTLNLLYVSNAGSQSFILCVYLSLLDLDLFRLDILTGIF